MALTSRQKMDGIRYNALRRNGNSHQEALAVLIRDRFGVKLNEALELAELIPEGASAAVVGPENAPTVKA